MSSEVWMKPGGDLVLVEWNVCRCHPKDVIVTWGKGFYDAASYTNMNKSVFTRQKRKQGWERL